MVTISSVLMGMNTSKTAWYIVEIKVSDHNGLFAILRQSKIKDVYLSISSKVAVNIC